MVRRAEKEWKEDPELPKGFLSASAVDLYLTCPKAFYFRYIAGEPDLSVPVSIQEGKAVHKALETNNLHKMDKGDDLGKDELVECFSDTWSDMAGDVNDWQESNRDDVHRRGTTFMERYLRSHAKKYTSTFKPERKITGYVGGVPMLGYIDYQDDGQILDYKVVKRKKSENDVAKGLQMGTYSIITGQRAVSFLCFVKKTQPSVETVKAFRDPQSLSRVAGTVKSVSEAIKKGSFPTCSPDSWKCQRKFCGFWHCCSQGGGDR